MRAKDVYLKMYEPTSSYIKPRLPRLFVKVEGPPYCEDIEMEYAAPDGTTEDDLVKLAQMLAQGLSVGPPELWHATHPPIRHAR